MTHSGFQLNDKLLDYGCGAGLFVNFLRQKGLPDVSGFDTFVSGYSNPNNLQPPYDAVVSYDVIEHDDDPRGFLKKLAGLVRPGGLVTIGTPRADGVSLKRIRDPQLHPPYHRHILSESVLLTLGQKEGLSPLQVYRRSFYDSLIPSVNSRFMWTYLERSGGLLDAILEPPRMDVIWRSPDLWFFACFGYFFPPGDQMIVTFRKPLV